MGAVGSTRSIHLPCTAIVPKAVQLEIERLTYTRSTPHCDGWPADACPDLANFISYKQRWYSPSKTSAGRQLPIITTQNYYCSAISLPTYFSSYQPLMHYSIIRLFAFPLLCPFIAVISAAPGSSAHIHCCYMLLTSIHKLV